MKKLILALVLSSSFAYSANKSLNFTVNISCSTAGICVDNSLDRGHTQVAILPTGYNCASDTSALSKSDYIAWGSNGALRCVSGTCTQSMTSFRFNNSVAGTYSVATELIVPPGDQLRILSCKDGVVLSEGSTITVDSNWTPNNP